MLGAQCALLPETVRQPAPLPRCRGGPGVQRRHRRRHRRRPRGVPDQGVRTARGFRSGSTPSSWRRSPWPPPSSRRRPGERDLTRIDGRARRRGHGEDLTMSLFDLTGRSALVTGSSRGIGLALAQGLLEAGARVVVHGRDHDVAEASAARLRETTGGETMVSHVRRHRPGRCRCRHRPHRAVLGHAGHPGQQRRHPAPGAVRRLQLSPTGTTSWPPT